MSATDDVLRDAGVEPPGSKSLAGRVVAVAREAGVSLFRDPGRTPYAGLDREVHAFDGGGVRSLLGRLLYQADGRIAGRNALDDAVDTLRAEALFGDAVEPVYLRVAPLPDGIAIDLGTSDWTAVVVKAGSWSILSGTPRHTTSAAMR